MSRLEIRDVKFQVKVLERLGLAVLSPADFKVCELPLSGSEKRLRELAGGRSAQRPVPLPRVHLRELARTKKKCLQRTLLAYLCRGLTISRDGQLSNKGTAKASWIAGVTGLSLRSVKAARSTLLQQGIITPDQGSVQRKLNRDGAYFSVVLDWSPSTTAHLSDVSHSKALHPKPEAHPSALLEFAPPLAQNASQFAPPYKDKKTPYGSKNQKAPVDVRPASGPGPFRKKGRGGSLPSIRNIVLEDLHDFYRTEMLYEQAVQAGWIARSESSFLNWFAAAVRAKTQREGDAVRIFAGIVRKKLFFHVTQAEEERARRGIQRFRFGIDSLPSTSPLCQVSERVLAADRWMNDSLQTLISN